MRELIVFCEKEEDFTALLGLLATYCKDADAKMEQGDVFNEKDVDSIRVELWRDRTPAPHGKWFDLFVILGLLLSIVVFFLTLVGLSTVCDSSKFKW